MWNAAGIDVTQSISDQSTLITDLYETNFEVSCFSNGTESDDPDIIWYNALHSESQTNYSGYATPEMDAALDAGRTSADESVRVEAYATVQRLLATETPLIQYLSSPWGWTVSDAVGGLVALPNGDFAPGDAFLR